MESQTVRFSVGCGLEVKIAWHCSTRRRSSGCPGLLLVRRIFNFLRTSSRPYRVLYSQKTAASLPKTVLSCAFPLGANCAAVHRLLGLRWLYLSWLSTTSVACSKSSPPKYSVISAARNERSKEPALSAGETSSITIRCSGESGRIIPRHKETPHRMWNSSPALDSRAPGRSPEGSGTADLTIPHNHAEHTWARASRL